MLFPKPNSMAQPSFGIGACAEPETVTGIPVSSIFDLYTRLSQMLNSFVNDCCIRDTIIRAYQNKCWGEIFGIA